MATANKKTEAAPEAPAAGKSIYEVFDTNPDEEVSGIWIDYGPFKFLIARAGGANRAFASTIERKMRPHRAAVASGAMDEKVAERLLAEAYADSILLKWEGVTDRQGGNLPFNKKNAVALLLDVPELFKALRAEAELLANFLQAGTTADTKS